MKPIIAYAIYDKAYEHFYRNAGIPLLFPTKRIAELFAREVSVWASGKASIVKVKITPIK